MPKVERIKEMDRRRKRKRERRREKDKVLRAQWEQKKQDKKEEKIVIKKAVSKIPSPKDKKE